MSTENDIPIELLQEMNTTLEDMRSIINTKYGIDINPIVSFDLRGKVAGQAIYRYNKIRLNLDLLLKYKSTFIAEVLPHEYGHLVVREKYGDVQSHGIEFYHIGGVLGYEFHRCHQFIVVPAKVITYYKYKMPCGCEFKVKALVHKKIQSYSSGYLCKKHKKVLLPEHLLVKTLAQRLSEKE